MDPGPGQMGNRSFRNVRNANVVKKIKVNKKRYSHMRPDIRKCGFSLCLCCIVSVMFATLVSAEERSVAGKVIRLRVTLSDVDLYAFKFQEARMP